MSNCEEEAMKEMKFNPYTSTIPMNEINTIHESKYKNKKTA